MTVVLNVLTDFYLMSIPLPVSSTTQTKRNDHADQALANVEGSTAAEAQSSSALDVWRRFLRYCVRYPTLRLDPRCTFLSFLS